MKVNGSIARMIIRELEKLGAIKRIVHSRAQLVYSQYISLRQLMIIDMYLPARATAEAAA